MIQYLLTINNSSFDQLKLTDFTFLIPKDSHPPNPIGLVCWEENDQQLNTFLAGYHTPSCRGRQHSQEGGVVTLRNF